MKLVILQIDCEDADMNVLRFITDLLMRYSLHRFKVIATIIRN